MDGLKYNAHITQPHKPLPRQLHFHLYVGYIPYCLLKYKCFHKEYKAFQKKKMQQGDWEWLALLMKSKKKRVFKL